MVTIFCKDSNPASKLMVHELKGVGIYVNTHITHEPEVTKNNFSYYFFWLVIIKNEYK